MKIAIIAFVGLVLSLAVARITDTKVVPLDSPSYCVREVYAKRPTGPMPTPPELMQVVNEINHQLPIVTVASR